MLIGHVGVAFAARRRWPTAPLGWLVSASFAPDIWRVALADSGYRWWPSNTYSHALPWSAIIAITLASLAWLMTRNGVTAVTVGAMVMAHIALDMISGWKPLWIGGPIGLDMYHVEQAEFLLEAVLAWIGWRLLRRTTVPRWLVTRRMLVLLLAVQAAYSLRTYRARPVATRCWSYPFSPCWQRL
jgi:hypothetical protein